MELKPCPFCGGLAQLVRYESDNQQYLCTLSIECDKCQCAMSDKLDYDESEAVWTDRLVEEWNTRV